MAYIPSKPLPISIVHKHQKPFTPSNGRPGMDAKTAEIGIIEQGTQNGQATMVICLTTEDGKNIFHEITGNQFEMLMGCYMGAKERFAARIKMNSVMGVLFWIVIAFSVGLSLGLALSDED